MKKKTIYNLVLVGLIIGSLFFVVLLIFEIRMDFRHDTCEDIYLWCNVEEGRYEILYRNVVHNRILNEKPSELSEDCYAVADYFMAANNYKINSELGREEEAKMYKKEMENLSNDLKKIGFDEKDIHRVLKISY